MNNSAKKPTALLDKSFIHPLSALEDTLRSQLWDSIISRFEIVIPWVLLEEVWKNYAQPGKKDPRLILNMVTQLKALSAYWVDDEINQIFEELVICKKTPSGFKVPEPEIIQRFLAINPNDPELHTFINQLREAEEEQLKFRILAQDDHEQELRTRGHSIILASESEFFRKVIKRRYLQILDDGEYRTKVFQQFFGEPLCRRFPKYSKRIARALRAYDRSSFSRFYITLGCFLAKLLYLYAPLYRIDNGSPAGRPIIRRSPSAQRGNCYDERYISSALVCSCLVTRDEGMAKIMSCFSQAGLWKGRLIFLPPQENIAEQIRREL